MRANAKMVGKPSSVAALVCAILLVGACGTRTPDVPVSDDETPAPHKEIETKVEGESNLKRGLKDGDSATFRDEFVSELEGGAQMLCGEVNSKNSFGGYTGFKRFIASPNPEAPNMVEGEEMSGMDIDAKTFRTAYKFACSNRVKTF